MDESVNFDNAPLPTQKQLRARTNIVIQAWRFAALNLKMMGMVRKGPH